jgi:flagellar hook-length control protein FliK
VVSVTPDIIVSPSFQAPPPRAKADQPSANDSFASLVDSNTTTANGNNERAQDTAASDKRAAASRRDEAAAADKGQSRDAKADRPDRSDASDRDVTDADQSAVDTSADAGAAKPAKTKSAVGQTDESKPGGKTSSDDTEATDSTDLQAATVQATTEIANAVATAIPVAAVVTDVQAAASSTTPKADGGPLAIAPAAIAAGTAVKEAATASVATQATTDTAAKAAAIGVATDAKAAAQAAAGETAAKTGLAALASDPAVATDAALTAAATAPVTVPKAVAPQETAPSTKGDATTASSDTDIAAASTDAKAAKVTTASIVSDTEQPAATKPALKDAHTEVAKTESTGAQAPLAAAAHFNNAAGRDAAPDQANVQANAVPAASVLQPQLQAGATQAQPSFTVTAAAQSAAVPLSGLAMEIAASANSGKSRFEIRLDPAELGRIDVRVDVDRNGQVTSHLTVEKPETLSMLRQDAPQLQRALNDAGLSTGDSGLQFSLRDQSSSGQNGNQSNSSAQRLIITEDEVVPAAVASSYGRMLGTSGGLDIRV